MISAEDLNACFKFHAENYESLGSWHLKPGLKVFLGEKDKKKRICRFCGEASPVVKFKKEAHGIPESLGNKSLTTGYECDSCNELFGSDIEDHFGRWSKPMRTLMRISGKNGVPSIRQRKDGGWRVDAGVSHMKISHYERDPIVEVDAEAHTMKVTLARDSYLPVAALKAFVKMGLTLLPQEEVVNFQSALAWIRNADHSAPFISEFPIFYSFVPGPQPNDEIVARVFRRKSDALLPYAFFVLTYGNETYQVFLPTPEMDARISGAKLQLRPYLTSYEVGHNAYGPVRRFPIHLTGRSIVKGESVPVTFRFERAELE